MTRIRGTWIVAAVGLLWGLAGAQEAGPASPYFECPYINYFDSGCPQKEEDEGRLEQPSERQDPEAVGEGESDYEENDHDWMEEAPEELLPLFPRESLAPDTPSLYRLLLMKPTLENARRYVRWHARRMKRIGEVQGLVDIAGREHLAGRAAGE